VLEKSQFYLPPGLEKPSFLKNSFSTKTDVDKHDSAIQKHLKSTSHRTHTVVYMVCSFPFYGLQHTKDKTSSSAVAAKPARRDAS